MGEIDVAMRAAGASAEAGPHAAAQRLGIVVAVVSPSAVVGRADAYVCDGVPCVAVSAADADQVGAVALGIGLSLAMRLGLPPMLRSAIARRFAVRFSGVAASRVASRVA